MQYVPISHSCDSSSAFRADGFSMFNSEFHSYPVTPDLNTVITLKNVTVHIVGDRSRFSWDKASAYGSPVAPNSLLSFMAITAKEYESLHWPASCAPSLVVFP